MFIMVGVSVIFSTSHAEARTFTDAKGREIEAEILARSGNDKIVIEREGKEFTVPIGMFSAEDQIFIKEWIAQNPDAVKLDVDFNYFVTLERKKMESEFADKVYRDERLQSTPYLYDVSVTNQGEHTLDKLKIIYQILIEDIVDANGNYRSMSYTNEKAKMKLQRIKQELIVDELPSKKRADFTKQFNVERYVDRDGGRVAVAAQDKIVGIWIRVYRDEQLLDEYNRTESGYRLDGIPWDEGASQDSGVSIR